MQSGASTPRAMGRLSRSVRQLLGDQGRPEQLVLQPVAEGLGDCASPGGEQARRSGRGAAERPVPAPGGDDWPEVLRQAAAAGGVDRRDDPRPARPGGAGRCRAASASGSPSPPPNSRASPEVAIDPPLASSGGRRSLQPVAGRVALSGCTSWSSVAAGSAPGWPCPSPTRATPSPSSTAPPGPSAACPRTGRASGSSARASTATTSSGPGPSGPTPWPRSPAATTPTS